MYFVCLGEEDAVKSPAKERPRNASTTIAEEAVDQLQASEKLIAGNLISTLFVIQSTLNVVKIIKYK